MKGILKIVDTALRLYLIAIPSLPVFAFSSNSENISQEEIQKNIHYLLREYRQILQKKDWKVVIETNQLRAYYYNYKYREIRAQIEVAEETDQIKFVISLANGGQHWQRNFIIKEKLPLDNAYARNMMLAFMLNPLFSEDRSQVNNQIFFSHVAIGYNRTHDNREFYPQWKEGSIYFAGELQYDPSINTKERDIPLSIGDYMSFDFYVAYDSQIRENYSNIDILLFGKHKYGISDSSSTRSLHGFFNGIEYFRPSFRDSTMHWDHQIYKKQPHIQFFLYRVLSWGFIRSTTGQGIYTTSFMAGIGPSINSSLTATGISRAEEDNLSHIFKSYPVYRRQNFYYSVALPLSVSFLVDKIHNLRLQTGYNWYLFYAIENERAYEMLNMLKLSVGYYLLDNLLFDINYEFWNINSRVASDTKQHQWNRIVLEIEYLL
ncbi:MAG: hypothetical protein SVZ03_10105 [Spirochaetota bacterium]|nr:hypothetical protein [Spirochaetota bacterium]